MSQIYYHYEDPQYIRSMLSQFEDVSIYIPSLEIVMYSFILLMYLLMALSSKHKILHYSVNLPITTLVLSKAFITALIENGIEKITLITLPENLVSFFYTLAILKLAYNAFEQSYVSNESVVKSDRAQVLNEIMKSVRKEKEINLEVWNDWIKTCIGAESSIEEVENLTDFKKVILSYGVGGDNCNEFKYKEIIKFNSYPIVKTRAEFKEFLQFVSNSYYLVFYDLEYLVTFLLTSGCLQEMFNKERLMDYLGEIEATDINEFAYQLLENNQNILNSFFD